MSARVHRDGKQQGGMGLNKDKIQRPADGILLFSTPKMKVKLKPSVSTSAKRSKGGDEKPSVSIRNTQKRELNFLTAGNLVRTAENHPFCICRHTKLMTGPCENV